MNAEMTKYEQLVGELGQEEADMWRRYVINRMKVVQRERQHLQERLEKANAELLRHMADADDDMMEEVREG